MKVDKAFAPITITIETSAEKEWLLTVLSVFAQQEEERSIFNLRKPNSYSERAKYLYKMLNS